jgi:hypothetical protein
MPELIVGVEGTFVTNINTGYFFAVGHLADKTGWITSLRFETASGAGGAQVLVGLYDDSGGEPNNLLTSGYVASASTGWNTVSVTPVRVIKGTKYHLCSMTDSTGGIMREAAGGGWDASWVVRSYGLGLPDPAPAMTGTDAYLRSVVAYGDPGSLGLTMSIGL